MATQKVWNATLKQYVNLEVDLQTEQEQNAESNAQKEAKRNKRNFLLQQSDWCVVSDSPLTDSQKQEVLTYRQKLRDWPTRAEWPDEDFPTPPDCLL
jgi:hypothetical protein